jgi:hypothetical protein
MNENVKLQEKALRALISVNKADVKSLLRKYRYRISERSSGNDLYAFLIVAISKDSAFTEDVLALLQKASNQPYKSAEDDDSSKNVTTIISGALQGLGMVTSTWQNVATTKANASMYNTTYTVDGKKFSTLTVVGCVLAGIILIGVMSIVVIKSTK